jgi:hypothetical protein
MGKRRARALGVRRKAGASSSSCAPTSDPRSISSKVGAVQVECCMAQREARRVPTLDAIIEGGEKPTRPDLE